MFPTRPWLDDIIIGLSYYFFTSLIVVLAVMFGHEFVKPPERAKPKDADLLTCFARWDGQNYKRIVTVGYSYDPERASLVAFFPAYPLLARVIMETTGCRPEAALLIVSHTFLAGCFVLLRRYVRERFPDAPAGWDYTLLAFGLFPTTFFFRMAYTESMFIFLTLLVLYGIERRWSPLLLAVIIGLATATRPVGVALLPVLLLHLWRTRASHPAFALQSLCLLPIACWGLIGYMAYLDAAFGDPLAFAKTQEHYRILETSPLSEKLISLVTLEPMWGLFDSSSPRYWAKLEWHGSAMFSLLVANPIFFLVTAGFTLLGFRIGWVTAFEALLTAALLGIPYVTRAFDNSMASGGRFGAVVSPFYVIIGLLLPRCPVCTRVPLLASFTLFLSLYAILFSAGYFLI